MRQYKFEDGRKCFTIPVGAVRSSRLGLEKARLLEVLARKSLKQITHITGGKFQPYPPVSRYNALMSIIKLTDPRYCSPLDSPNTHLSSSKGRRVFEVLALSGTLRRRLGELTGPREQKLGHTGDPWWFPLIFEANTRAAHTRGVQITKLPLYQPNYYCEILGSELLCCHYPQR